MATVTFSRKLPLNYTTSDLALFEGEQKRIFDLPLERCATVSNVQLNYIFLFDPNKQKAFHNFGFYPIFNLGQKPTLGVRIKKKRVKLKQVNFVFDKNSNNYFHWMLEVLPRIIWLEENHPSNNPYVLPDYVENNPGFLFPLYKVVPKERIVFLKSDTLYTFEKCQLCATSYNSGNYNPSLLQQVKSQFLLNEQAPSRRFLVLRTGIRAFKNEQEIVTILSGLGFETVRFENHTLEEQIALIQDCECLIGAHGAGLTNMLFLNPAAKVIECRFTDDSTNNCYFTLASDLNLAYYYLTCERSVDQLIVEPSELYSLVKGIFS